MENSTHNNMPINEIFIYNEGVDLIGFDWNGSFCDSKKISSKNFNADIEKIKPTAFNFIYNRLDEFENWLFTEQQYITSFL